MTNRITEKMLDARVNQLNVTLGYPTEYCTPSKIDGKLVCNPNHYCIGQAYGGYRLEQLVGQGGGARDISPQRIGLIMPLRFSELVCCGTKREIWDYTTAMIAGAEQALNYSD